jgi:hypothetical protein
MSQVIPSHEPASERYARCLATSKRIEWTVDELLDGKRFEPQEKFMPDGLSRLEGMPFLSQADRVALSQIQGRTYANIFGLVERFINTKVLELAGRHALGDQVALEALVQFSREELKHQELFRRVERLSAEVMPAGYQLVPAPDPVAGVVLGKSTWSVLALTYLIELFTQIHYKKSIEPDAALSQLYKDVFRHHFLEESQHAILDELEWRAEDARLDAAQRDRAVDDLIALVGAVDGILCAQATADASYFVRAYRPASTGAERAAVEACLLAAYRYQYIFSGVQETKFTHVLAELIEPPQIERITSALASMSAGQA